MATSRARIVVCATGTEVGKTHVCCALLGWARAAGHEVIGLKPIESGVEGEHTTDAQRLAGACGSSISEALFAYRDPVSPHLAARRESRPIDLGAIAQWIDGGARSLTIVETAGGLLSPLSHTTTNRDLVAAAKPSHVLLVAPDRLGVLHDVTASLLALAGIGLRRKTIVALSAPAAPDASTGTNQDELVGLGIAPTTVTFPRAEPDAQASQAAAEAVMFHVQHP